MLNQDYKIGICCFSAKHAELRRKSKDWLARNQNNVSEWSDMSTRGLLFQWTSTINIQLSVLISYIADHISFKINLFSPWYSWKIAELVLNNNHSILVCWIVFAHYLSFSDLRRLNTPLVTSSFCNSITKLFMFPYDTVFRIKVYWSFVR